MSTGRTRIRSIVSRLGTFLEALLIFILLFSGVGVIFVGTITGQIGPTWLLLIIGVSVEVIGLLIIGLYAYFRFLRQRNVADT
ncbi:MAG: hypothetical protein Q6364_10485 [Candidatus Hermodarchaeota archaeon]|nr:hypothetical protein [Candidatus Hermodarchaeota archaeon]